MPALTPTMHIELNEYVSHENFTEVSLSPVDKELAAFHKEIAEITAETPVEKTWKQSIYNLYYEMEKRAKPMLAQLDSVLNNLEHNNIFVLEIASTRSMAKAMNNHGLSLEDQAKAIQQHEKTIQPLIKNASNETRNKHSEAINAASFAIAGAFCGAAIGAVLGAFTPAGSAMIPMAMLCAMIGLAIGLRLSVYASNASTNVNASALNPYSFHTMQKTSGPSTRCNDIIDIPPPALCRAV